MTHPVSTHNLRTGVLLFESLSIRGRDEKMGFFTKRCYWSSAVGRFHFTVSADFPLEPDAQAYLRERIRQG
jgi:hypothetical protein